MYGIDVALRFPLPARRRDGDSSPLQKDAQFSHPIRTGGPDMMNTQVLANCRRHKSIAEMALSRLSQLKIKSNNKFWQSNERVSCALATQRAALGYGDKHRDDDIGIVKGSWRSLENDDFVADMTFNLGAGNCDEKASVFGVLASHDRRVNASKIYRCSFMAYDHVIAVMCANTMTVGASDLGLSQFGDEAIVLDGWAEDWWFPNVSAFDVLRYDLWRGGDPFALTVRAKSQYYKRLRICSMIC